MKSLTIGCVLGSFLTVVSPGFGRDKVSTPDLSQINNGKAWSLINGACSTAMEDGKTVVRMKPKMPANTPSNVGLALVEGVDFTEGTIEIDLKGRGKVLRSFVGVGFHVEDGNTFEAVYFRPFNFMREGFQGHAVQYVAWPVNTWEKLRQEKPGVYENDVSPVPNPAGWFHARIEVGKEKVKVWVNDAKEPCLVVDRLGNHNSGKVGLWVDSQEGAFSNLKIVPAR